MCVCVCVWVCEYVGLCSAEYHGMGLECEGGFVLFLCLYFISFHACYLFINQAAEAFVLKTPASLFHETLLNRPFLNRIRILC